ncbi:MAG: hypothetical protein NVSMB12_07030 [Acidimicrobiales bacterium]
MKRIVPTEPLGHHGVVDLQALASAGLSPAAARTAVRDGTLERPGHGIFVHPAGRDEWTPIMVEQRRFRDLVLTGPSALRLHGCDGADAAPNPADLRRTRRQSRAAHEAARRVRDADIVVIAGIRVLRPLPLVARTAGPAPALVEAAIETFLRSGRLTEQEILSACTGAGGTPLIGAERRTLRAIMDRRGWGVPPTESYLETLTVQRVLRPAGLAHTRQVVITLGGAYLKRFDFQLESGLLLNCHGMAFHTSKAAVQQDATYGLRLRMAGLHVETVTWDDVTRRPRKTAHDLAIRSAQVAQARTAAEAPRSHAQN